MKYKKRWEDYSVPEKILLYALGSTKVALNILGLFSLPNLRYKLNTDKWPWETDKYYFSMALGRMQRSGIIKVIKQRGPVIEIEIKRKGLKRFRKLIVKDLSIKRQEKWDGLIRQVSFDIPEDLREIRDLFRGKMKELGFVRVQQSVWVHLYPCHDEIMFLCKEYKIEKYVSLFEGRYLGDDKKLIYQLKKANKKVKE